MYIQEEPEDDTVSEEQGTEARPQQVPEATPQSVLRDRAKEEKVKEESYHRKLRKEKSSIGEADVWQGDKFQ